MAWIKSHQTLERHPKVNELASLMDMSVPEVIGRLHMFWWWVLDYVEDGVLDRYSTGSIEKACGIPLNFLIQSGFVDEKSEKKVHDWWDYVGDFLRTKYRKHPKKWRRIRSLYSTRSNTVSRTPIDKIRKDKIRKDNTDIQKTESVSKKTIIKTNKTIESLIARFEKDQEVKLGEKPIFNRGAARSGFRKLLKNYDAPEITHRIEVWFRTDNKFFESRGFRVEDFVSNFNNIREAVSGALDQLPEWERKAAMEWGKGKQ